MAFSAFYNNTTKGTCENVQTPEQNLIHMLKQVDTRSRGVLRFKQLFYFSAPKSKRQILFHGFLALARKCPRCCLMWLRLRGQTPKQRFREECVAWYWGRRVEFWRRAKRQQKHHAYYLFIIISKSFSGSAQSGARSQLPRAQLSKQHVESCCRAHSKRDFSSSNLIIFLSIIRAGNQWKRVALSQWEQFNWIPFIFYYFCPSNCT